MSRKPPDSQIEQADRVNKRLSKQIKDPLEAGDIARVEDAKTHKRALVMVTEAVRRRNVKSGIVYYRYKVCSRYGHIDRQTWISYNMQVQKRRLCSECQLCVQEKWKALQ